ncbi:MAG: hypothetical protein MRY83_19420 [Flavobacteriales bacterium]|nr:hypothetical protein [Flavobacteriales bacterium]
MKSEVLEVELKITNESFWDLYPGYSQKTTIFNHDHTASISYLSILTFVITCVCTWFYLSKQIFLDYLIISSIVLFFFLVLLIIRRQELHNRLDTIRKYISKWGEGNMKKIVLSDKGLQIHGNNNISEWSWNDIYQVKIEPEFIQTDVRMGQNLLIPKGTTSDSEWENIKKFLESIDARS